MPPVRKNPGDRMDCSKRSVNPFQTYVNHLITKKPEKIKLLLARALMNDDFLMDFNGQIHANECVFSYPDSNWYSVYLIDSNGQKYWGSKGAQKFYFQMEFKLNDIGVPIDAFPINGTFETPAELIVNGSEIKNCIVKDNGRCANPESKKKKKKSTSIDEGEYEDNSSDETSEEILQTLSGAGVSAPNKQKMPRDYFESLGSKSMIIDWMINNMKPAEIFKCIQHSSLSADDIKQAQSLLQTMPETGKPESKGASQEEIKSVIDSFSPSEVNSMIKTITKEELIAAVSKIKNADRKKQGIIGLCKRAGIKKYSLETNAKTGKLRIVDSDGDIIDDIGEILDECAEKEAYRLKKILKIKSISQDVKKGKFSKYDLINYKGGKVRLPYSLMASIQRHFPLIKDFENRNGELFAKIPSEREDGILYYYKLDDVVGNDLQKLDNKMKQGTVSFGKRKNKRKSKRKSNLKSLKSDLIKLLKIK